jgi:hypothetical protein
MLDPRASAHTIFDQAELLICVVSPHFRVLRCEKSGEDVSRPNAATRPRHFPALQVPPQHGDSHDGEWRRSSGDLRTTRVQVKNLSTTTGYTDANTWVWMRWQRCDEGEAVVANELAAKVGEDRRVFNAKIAIYPFSNRSAGANRPHCFIAR